VLIIGLFVLVIVVWFNLPDSTVLEASFSAERMSLRTPGESWLSVVDTWSIPIIGSLFTAELITRMLASKNANVARNGTLLGGTLYLCIGLVPLTLGMWGYTLLPGLEEPEQILPMLAQTYLPTVLYVIFAGALVSAILSTVDSALLAAGALVSHNLILPLLPGMDERHKVRISRLTVVGFGVCAYVLARNADSVLGLVEEASAFGSAGIFTCCLMGLTQRRGGPLTAAASMVTGMVSYGVLAYLVEHDYAYLMSLLCAFSTFTIVMWFERPAGDERLMAMAG
ncbi:MAG: sodium:solute symporter, partial [Gammaproteobacteria bacterium]